MAFDISTYRHGTTHPEYDDNGRQVDSKYWELRHRFTCVEGSQFYNAYRNFSTVAHTTEQELQHKLFYIENIKQEQQRNLDVLFGDYLLEEHTGYWWKILSVVAQEFMPNCYIIIIRGQRLTNREESKVLIRTNDEEARDIEQHRGR